MRRGFSSRGSERGGYRGRGGGDRGGSRGRGRGGRGRGRGGFQPQAPLEPIVYFSQDDKLLVDSSSAVLPRRPGFGTIGTKVNLWSNFFEVEYDQGLTVIHYGIDSF